MKENAVDAGKTAGYTLALPHLRDLANEPNWTMTLCSAQRQCAGLQSIPKSCTMCWFI